MSWGKIKYALNSTVGTTGYKPLDKIILDNVRLIATDDVLFAYDGEWVLGGDSVYAYGQHGYKTSSFITFDTAGTVRFMTTQRGYGQSSAQSYTIRVYDSSDTVVAYYSADIPYQTVAELSIDINVTAGSKYKFSCSCSQNYSAPAKSLNVCGTPVPKVSVSKA